jgi:hypothetical protein
MLKFTRFAFQWYFTKFCKPNRTDFMKIFNSSSNNKKAIFYSFRKFITPKQRKNNFLKIKSELKRSKSIIHESFLKIGGGRVEIELFLVEFTWNDPKIKIQVVNIY